MLKSVNFEIIDICNLKCRMCDIWKNNIRNTISVFDFEKILDSHILTKDTNITLTGGEPLIHTEIKAIFTLFHDKGFKINTLSTNGILYEKLDELLIYCLEKNIELPNIHISIDGLENNHDLQRGVKGSFKKSINTIIQLKKNYKDIHIKIKYTITKNNIENIKKLYILAQKLGVEIDFKNVDNDEFYTNKIDKPILLEKADKLLIAKILREIYNKNIYANNLIYYLENDKLNFKCSTPNSNLFIMANGETYCCTKYECIGNVKNEKLDDIYYNMIHKNIIDIVDKNNCSKCYSLHGSFKSVVED